jgi:hypothetical protein
LCNAEYALGEALTPPPPELIPVVMPDAQPSAALTGEATAEPPPPHEESQGDSEGENEAAAAAIAFPAKPVAARRRRKPKSPLQTLLEVVAGGLAGCLVAYYGLALFYGPALRDKGLPILPLPGIESITAPRPAPGDANEKPPQKKPAKSKSKTETHGESAARSQGWSGRRDVGVAVALPPLNSQHLPGVAVQLPPQQKSHGESAARSPCSPRQNVIQLG